jgi:ribosomal protein L11 methyltransferase
MRRRATRGADVVFRVTTSVERSEALVAELGSLGTSGLEERALADGRVELLAYFESGELDPAAVLALADAAQGVTVAEAEPVPDTDWEQAWRAGLRPRRIGRLWVRPSFCESAGEPELVIDPQQAFGSGEHATTRLALGLVQEALRAGDSLLDLGTGSGILALGALRCGAARAVGLDLDPVAVHNASENRARNGLPLALACGNLESLAAGARFDVVVANLLLHELTPCARQLASHAARELILSGYLASERERLAVLVDPDDWRLVHESSELQSGDRWCARRLVHR